MTSNGKCNDNIRKYDVMVAIEIPVTSLPSASPLTSSSSSLQEDKHSLYPEEWRHVDQVTMLLKIAYPMIANITTVITHTYFY